MPNLIVEPGLPYLQLAGRLRALDYTWLREAQTPPTISGEPELVLWAHEASETRLVYTFNPVVLLRALSFSGPDAPSQRARVASFLPHLTIDRVADFIREDGTEACLLGLFAARELELSMLLPIVHQRTDDADELVARIATEVETALLGVPFQHARAVVAKLSARPTEGTLTAFGDAPLRRQLIRQAGIMDVTSRPGLDWLLRAGLRDADWEVRATAMLLCARCGLSSECEVIRNLDFAEPGKAHIDPKTVERLRRLQSVAVELLCGGIAASDAKLDTHARQCIAGKDDGQFDALFLLVFALTTPVELAGPVSLPSHVVRTSSGYALARSKLELSYVAPLPCWLGDPDPNSEPRSPLRRVVPQSGFFILTQALTANALRRACASAGEPELAMRWLEPPPTEQDAPTGAANAQLAVTLQNALAIAQSLSRIEGAAIELPGPDQWEMAARGPDARRYPWGNFREPNPRLRLSPWAVVGMTGGLPEWAKSTHGAPTACGGPTLTCHERRPGGSVELLALRPITS